MLIAKTRWFARWARRERLTDAVLRSAVDEMRRGLVDAVLGKGLVKKRVARVGGGKSGGFRTLLATNMHDRWVFVYGFAKSERESIEDRQLQDLQRLARAYLSLSETETRRLLEAGVIQEATGDQP